MLDKNAIKAKIKNWRSVFWHLISNNTAVVFFLFFGVVFSMVFFIHALNSKGQAIVNLFFGDLVPGDDTFMDFYNSVRDASLKSEAYTERNVIYPPMANLIFYIYSQLINPEYTSSDFSHREGWINYPDAVFVGFVFLVIPILILTLLVMRRCRNLQSKSIVAILFLCSAPMIYTIERANIIMYAMLGIALYAFFYDSDNKLLREISLLGLAFSFSIKLYPVIFGWFLIADKRYKDSLRCLLYGVTMLLVPSLFFGGPHCFAWIFENIVSFSGAVDDPWLFSLFGEKTATVINCIFVIMGAISFAIIPLLGGENRPRIYALGLSVLFLIPSLSNFYSWIFLIIPVCLFVANKKLLGFDYLYFFAAFIPMLLYPNTTLKNYVAIANVCSYFIVFTAFVELILLTVKHFRSRRKIRS